MINVSVVICAYTDKRWHELVAAVKSVWQQSLTPQEVIIVVDHNPNLYRRVRQHIPGVAVIENKEPRGLSGTRNSGIAAAQGEIIAFIDEDAIAAPDWLAQLCTDYNDPRILGVGGLVEPLWPGSRPTWFPEEFDWVIGCTYRGMPPVAAPVRNLIGCNMSFRRKVFEVAGGFRNDIGHIGPYPLGCDETEFCIRVRQSCPSGVLRYQPRARVYHQVSPDRLSWRYFRSRCYFEGRSKAVVTRLVGNKDALASERAYALQTLPQGVFRGLADAFLLRDRAGLMRAGAIIAGLTITTAGYLSGTVHRVGTPERETGPTNRGLQ